MLLALTSSQAPLTAQERPAVAFWSFDNNLKDGSGRDNHAFAEAPSFPAGHSGQGLQCHRKAALVPDAPELRPAPGLRIDCWVKIDSFGKSFDPLLIKDGDYQLRLDPPSEGSRFSFFLNVDGWEPRVSSTVAPTLGAWHHLQAGWDGKAIWLDLDGAKTTRPRAGSPRSSAEPLELGLFEGVLDDLRIENPDASHAGTAQWLFEGNLNDSSGHGFDLSGKPATFVPVPGGQALQGGPGRFQTPSRPELQLSPGLQIDCSVCFDEIPKDGQLILIKDGEYQLRVDPAAEGSRFAFFTNLGSWEPRVRSQTKMEPGRWYRITARWDGFAQSLEVDGLRERITRSGLPKPKESPLMIGGFRGRIDNLRIENPRLPTFRVKPSIQEHAILCAGRPEKMVTTLLNVGQAAGQVTIRIEPPPGVRCLGNTTYAIGDMPSGCTQKFEWTVQADAPSIGSARMEVKAANAPTMHARHPLVFFPSEDASPPPAIPVFTSNTNGSPAPLPYYIDSTSGNNGNSGRSPGAPWKDFANINGKTLTPGEKLLIRRGSVLRQELCVGAAGTKENWVEIGSYGSGPRPIISRTGDIEERCALIRNPDYLRIHGLQVCRAGKGLVVHYSESGHRGLVIEDCIAHHIEGLYRHNSHGIPEWLDRRGAEGDGLHISAGIALSGAPATEVVLRDCDTYQNSSGFFVQGNDPVVDRVFCHDNIAHNTSPHPFLVGIKRAVLQNSVFDASGWHASAGTMGIMLGDPQGLIIRNCVFRNQPDSGSHDEGGIDFENSGNGCLIDHCTFENNAGAAIEMLGLKAPQTTNVEIRNSRFIRNNVARKLGPSEIFIWGQVRDPSVCCSNGLIRDNGFVTLPGVEFFVNQAPELTDWTLRDNRGYASLEELAKAMPFNQPPVVRAGNPIRTDQLRVPLSGNASDDGQPRGRSLTTLWEVLDGPGEVVFENAASPTTLATFNQPGDYTLRLKADDGEFWLSDRVAVHILPPKTRVLAAWEFNQNLNKEGWTEENPGTEIRQWANSDWPTTSHPVKLVTGGQYVLAIENSKDARLISPAPLGVSLTGSERVELRFQNHTPASRMRLRFITAADQAWDDAKCLEFNVEPNDTDYRNYSLDLAKIPGWKGSLQQLRIDLATGNSLTGTCRFDYIWIRGSSNP